MSYVPFRIMLSYFELRSLSFLFTWFLTGILNYNMFYFHLLVALPCIAFDLHLCIWLYCFVFRATRVDAITYSYQLTIAIGFTLLHLNLIYIRLP